MCACVCVRVCVCARVCVCVRASEGKGKKKEETSKIDERTEPNLPRYGTRGGSNRSKWVGGKWGGLQLDEQDEKPAAERNENR